MRVHAALFASVLLVTACEGGRDDSVPAIGEFPAAEEAQSLGRGAATDAAPPAPAAPPAAVGATAGSPSSATVVSSALTTSPGSTTMLIRTGSASVEVDSLEPAIEAARRLVAGVGGYVGGTSLQAGDESVRSATLELRIPADRFDAVVAGLAPLGELDYVNVTAQDVGEEYVDLTARVENARRLESRLVELLAARTGKLSDVLAVERELSRVREEIERIEGRMRWLQSRAAMSSLTLTMHEPAPFVGQPGDRPISDAFRQAWRNAVAFAAWFIAALGVGVPLAVLVGLGVSLWRRFAPRRRLAPAAGDPT